MIRLRWLEAALGVLILCAVALGQGNTAWNAWNPEAGDRYTPQPGGKLRVCFKAEPELLDHFLDNSAYTNYICEYIQDTLVKQDRGSLEFRGDLAEKFVVEDILLLTDGSKLVGAVSESASEYSVVNHRKPEEKKVAKDKVKSVVRGAAFTFYLRKGVLWHDGKPLTIDDVMFTYRVIRNETVDAASLRNYFADLHHAEVLDQHTIYFEYSKQYWNALSIFSDLYILPKHLLDPNDEILKDPVAFGQKFNENPYRRKPVGTGRYKFEKWETGNRIVLTKNEKYWGVPGNLDTIEFVFIVDDVVALQAFKKGDIDFIPRMTNEQYLELKKEGADKQHAMGVFYHPNFNYIGWNTRKPPFDDPLVRQAMTLAGFDRDAFLRDVLKGLGVSVNGFQYVFGPAKYEVQGVLGFDPDRAEELLLEAGWYDRDGDGIRDKDGLALKFEMLSPPISAAHFARQMFAIMIENYKKLGIVMTVKEIEWATFIEHLQDRKFDACTLAWAQPIESDPYQLWHTSEAENRGSNHTGFGDEESDRIIEASRLELDPVKRRELFRQLGQKIYDSQPYTFLYCLPDKGIYNKRYHGVRFYGLRPGYQFWEWYVPKSN